ncbi:MAG: hypothetical protein M0P69_18035 [Bacteroidales bacterium]|jgi:hypothetical protein|nr:hypothetical protein [Bacteroidales bacterium]
MKIIMHATDLITKYIQQQLDEKLGPGFTVTVSSERIIGRGEQIYITASLDTAFTITDLDLLNQVDIKPVADKSINSIISQASMILEKSKFDPPI